MASAGNVARIVQLNGGRLIGKTRLQKSAYFLEALGIGFGFDFDYHHYGPYSEELAQLGDDARSLGFLKEIWQTSQDGAEYAILTDTGSYKDKEEAIDKDRRRVLGLLRDFSAVELELAATAHFLMQREHSDQAWIETRERKFSKISEERLARAKKLFIPWIGFTDLLLHPSTKEHYLSRQQQFQLWVQMRA
jgi:uncharacterized protein YwgA